MHFKLHTSVQTQISPQSLSFYTTFSPQRGINRRREVKRISGVSSCSAGPRYCSLATGPAIIINIICLYHSPGTFAFSQRYEDDMLINEYSRHSAIRPAPHPPSPASSPHNPHPPSPSPHPQKGRNADLFSSRLPHSIVVCTKGDKFNSFL